MNMRQPILALLLGALLTAAANGQQIPDRATLNALLGPNQTLEDFEELNVPPGSWVALPWGLPLFTLDSNTVLNGQGPGLVDAGASYRCGANGGSWWGDGVTGIASQSLGLFGSQPQRLTYSPPVQAFGIDLAETSFVPVTREMNVYDSSGALVGQATSVSSGVLGHRTFLGWQHAPGISHVEFINVTHTGNGTDLDDHGFGDLGPTVLISDDCPAATVAPVLGSTTFDFDTNYCLDTGAAATTSVWQTAACPTANNDGWVRWRPSVGGMVTIDTCNNANFDTVLAVYRETSPCQGIAVACNDDGPGCAGFTSSLTFTAHQTSDYLIQIGAYSAGVLGQGTVRITEHSAGPQNDDCANAIGLVSGVAVAFDTSNATMSVPSWGCALGGNDLWYSYTSVGDGDISLTLCNSTYDTALEVFSGSCASPVSVLCNDDSCGLQSAATFTPTAGTVYLVRVGGYNGATGSGEIELAQAMPLGTNYCTANPNSTGQTGLMSVAGSSLVADNDLTLTASRLPMSAFGFFIAGTTSGFIATPSGSSGNLCLLPPIGRYVHPTQIRQSGATGSFSLVLDLNLTPTPTGLVAVQAGETWFFQAWHRDAVSGTTTSNFTDGIRVTFQ